MGILELAAEAAALRVHHLNHRYKQTMSPIHDEIGSTLMQIIRSVAFEGSEANSMRTISFDSSTTVDDISTMTSLQNNAIIKTVHERSEKVNETNGVI